jgi:hypothetical protein
MTENVPEARQGGEAGDGMTSIEVTAEMINAGVCALEAYRDAFGDPQLVRAVYIAMVLEKNREVPESECLSPIGQRNEAPRCFMWVV